MKKILLITTILLSCAFSAQTKKPFLKFEETAKKLTVAHITKTESLLDYKIDSIKSENLTRKGLILDLMSLFNSKQSDLLSYIEEEQEKAKYLPASERIARFEELSNLLAESNYSEKGKVLIHKYDTADDKKTLVVVSRVYYYLLDKNGFHNYEQKVYFKPSGERITDIYKYYLANQ